MSHRLGEVIDNLSIDCVIFGFEKNNLEVLLVKRAIEPYKGEWALPGGFILKNEEIEDGAARILDETSGLTNIFMEQLGVFGKVDRYPLRRVFTAGYYALVSPEKYTLNPGTDTSEAKWVPLKDLTPLPFDHDDITSEGLRKLRIRIRNRPIGFELLPKKFTLPQLQSLYESILGVTLDKRNFRKKVEKMDLLIKLNEKDRNNIRRAANLYCFDKKNYNRLLNQGFSFVL